MSRSLEFAVPPHDSKFAEVVRKLCLEGFAPAPRKFPSHPVWAAVQKAGSELWLDTGDVEEAESLWSAEFSALTTNNTLLNREVQKGTYDDLVPRAAETLRKADPGIDERLMILELAFILNAVHGLKLVETFGAHVSVELHTDLAHDVDAAVEYGRRFHAISPDQFYVKVPLSAAGCLAARRLVAGGVPINFTLGFSARQNYVIALTARPTFVNVFMGRLNAFAAGSKLNDGSGVGEKATLASQRVILGLRGGPEALATRQIGASMRSGSQVADLLGLDVFTMPPAAARDFLASDPDPAGLKSRLEEEKEVRWNPGIDEKAAGLGVFWEVSEDLRKAMCKLFGEHLDSMNPSDFASFLAAAGVPDLFPRFTEAELQRIAKDGKAPSWEAWKDEVAKGRLAWDTLFTEAGLLSFAADQHALDDRIRQALKG